MEKQEDGSKAGVESGETDQTPGPKGDKRPVEEEDVFGGGERVRKSGKDPKSENAKP